MFQLHENTQRQLSRAAFVLLCPLPTTLLLAYVLWLRTPGYREAEAREISQAAGMDVTLDALLHPRPGHTRLSTLRILDPETGTLVARVRELEIASSRGRTLLAASQPEIQSGHLETIWRRAEERLLRGTLDLSNPLEFVAGEVTLHSPEGESQTLTNVRLRVSKEAAGPTLTCEYRVAGVEMPEPAVIQISRRRDGDALGTRIDWHTGGTALAVAPWQARFSWLAALGPRCGFRGTCSAEQMPMGWRGELQGELLNVDLDRLVSDHFPHKLSGPAKVQIDNAEFIDGRLAKITCRIDAGPGVVGQSLIDAAAQHWRITPSSDRREDSPDDSLHHYQQLAARFEMESASLTLEGVCGGQPPGTLLVREEGRTLQTPENAACNTTTLLRVLVPQSDLTVPASEATRQLMQILPLPPAGSSEDGEQPPRSHLRSGE